MFLKESDIKIFTSRYSNPELRSGKYTVVGVTRGLPKFNLGYILTDDIKDFGPPGYLFHENDRFVFTPKYFAYMDSIGIERVEHILSRYKVYGKDIVLCCYEDVREPNEWCHRLVFAEWYEQKTGCKINELYDPTPVKGLQKPTPVENQFVQMSLFDIRP